MQNVTIDDKIVYSDDHINIINDFVNYVIEYLQLKTELKINITGERKENMTYGMFDPSTQAIVVYGKNRGLADVLRTLCHEIVHLKQKELNKIPSTLNKRDLKLEAEANTIAGDIVYMFGLKNPLIYKLSDINLINK